MNSKWFLVDCSSSIVLGRLASKIASVLSGKHKPSYAPYLDIGDNVVVINVKDILTTGNKLKQKQYFRHTGYPGGIKSRTLEEMIAKDPRKVLYKAVKGMLPKNKLGSVMLKRLKLYANAEHPHLAQQPVALVV